MQQNKLHHIAVGSLETNCWIYAGPKSCTVIDPGSESNRIIAFLKKLDLYPDYILLTHGHFDHIGAVKTLVFEYSGNEGGKPAVAIHRADENFIDGKFSVARHLEEGETIGPFTVLHLPGHSPGSTGLWDREEGILFSGDTLFCGDYGRTDLPGGSEKQIIASLKRLFALDGSIQVYPGHGPATTIADEAERQKINHIPLKL